MAGCAGGDRGGCLGNVGGPGGGVGGLGGSGGGEGGRSCAGCGTGRGGSGVQTGRARGSNGSRFTSLHSGKLYFCDVVRASLFM